MKVIKSIGVAGSLESFIPQISPSAPIPEAVEEPVVELTAQEKREALRLEFADELNELRLQAKHEGYIEGKAKAEEDAQEQLNKQLADLESNIKAWADMTLKLENETHWELAQEEDFYTLLFQATTKLLLKDISSKEHIDKIVADLIDEYTQKNIKTLVVSSLHYEHLSQLKLLGDLEEKFEILTDSEMMPGSFKLGLKHGFIEYDLDASLTQFKEALVSLTKKKVELS